jgi:hypothetical protein
MKQTIFFLTTFLTSIATFAESSGNLVCTEVNDSSSTIKNEYKIEVENNEFRVEEIGYIRKTKEIYQSGLKFKGAKISALNSLLQPGLGRMKLPDLRLPSDPQLEALDLSNERSELRYSQLLIQATYKPNQLLISQERLSLIKKNNEDLDLKNLNWTTNNMPIVEYRCESVK